MKEEALLTKLRDTEHAQLVTEMRRHIAELELQVIKCTPGLSTFWISLSLRPNATLTGLKE